MLRRSHANAFAFRAPFLLPLGFAAIAGCATVDSLRGNLTNATSGSKASSAEPPSAVPTSKTTGGDAPKDSSCRSEFVSKRYAALNAEQARVEAAIAAADKLSGPHERLLALIGLRKTIKDWSQPGAPYQLEVAILKQADSPVTWLFRQEVHAASGYLDLRPLQPAETEATLACDPSGPDGRAARDAVQQAGTLRNLQRQGEAKARAQQTVGLLQNEDPLPSAPFLAIASDFVISSVKEDGPRLALVVEKRRSDQVILGCREAQDRLVSENGKLVRDRSCSYGSRVTKVEVEFSVLREANFDFKVEDKVALVAQVTPSPAVKKKTGTEESQTIRLKADSAFLVDVRRKGVIVTSPREAILSAR